MKRKIIKIDEEKCTGCGLCIPNCPEGAIQMIDGKALAIACPKLDSDQDVYLEKLRSLIDDAKINTLTVMIMEVPCCRGLLNLAREAIAAASRKIPLKCIVVSLDGKVKSEEWVN